MRRSRGEFGPDSRWRLSALRIRRPPCEGSGVVGGSPPYESGVLARRTAESLAGNRLTNPASSLRGQRSRWRARSGLLGAIDVRLVTLAGGSPAASYFSCAAKKSNPKKAAPAAADFPVRACVEWAEKELATLRQLSPAFGYPTRRRPARLRQRGKDISNLARTAESLAGNRPTNPACPMWVQRSQAARLACNRVRSGFTQRVSVIKGTNLNVHGASRERMSGQLRNQG